MPNHRNMRRRNERQARSEQTGPQMQPKHHSTKTQLTAQRIFFGFLCRRQAIFRLLTLSSEASALFSQISTFSHSLLKFKNRQLHPIQHTNACTARIRQSSARFANCGAYPQEEVAPDFGAKTVSHRCTANATYLQAESTHLALPGKQDMDPMMSRTKDIDHLRRPLGSGGNPHKHTKYTTQERVVDSSTENTIFRKGEKTFPNDIRKI